VGSCLEGGAHLMVEGMALLIALFQLDSLSFVP